MGRRTESTRSIASLIISTVSPATRLLYVFHTTEVTIICRSRWMEEVPICRSDWVEALEMDWVLPAAVGGGSKSRYNLSTGLLLPLFQVLIPGRLICLGEGRRYFVEPHWLADNGPTRTALSTLAQAGLLILKIARITSLKTGPVHRRLVL